MTSKVSKHDLCSDTVILDYDKLIAVAITATVRSKNEIYRRLSEADQIGMKDSDRAHAAKYLHEAAEDFMYASDTLMYLTEGKKREKVIIINQPELI